MVTPKKYSPVNAGSVSERIRARIQKAGAPFHANDNIADYIEDGELDALQAEVQEKFTDVLHSLVIDVNSDHNTAETAKRLAKMYIKEVFQGVMKKRLMSPNFRMSVN